MTTHTATEDTTAKTKRTEQAQRAVLRPLHDTEELAATNQSNVSFTARCSAVLVDYTAFAVLVALLTLFVHPAVGGRQQGASIITFTSFWVITSAFAVNYVLWPWLSGQTLGKWATGLRMVRTDGRRLRLHNVLLRHLLGYPLSLLIGGIGFLLALFNPRQRALHDFLAGTVVVAARVGRLRSAAPVR